MARVDASEGFESIYVGRRLVSRAMIGAKPEGHAISGASSTLVVRFDPVREAFELRADGRLVALSAMPAAMSLPLFSPSLGPPPRTSSSAWRWVVAVVVTAIVGISTAGVVRSRLATPEPPGGQLTASTDVVRFHYPKGFVTKPEKSEDVKAAPPQKPTPMRSSYLSAGHYKRDEGIFVISVSSGKNLGGDPWLLSNAFHKSFAEIMKQTLFAGKTSTMAETDRQDETCLGQPGSAAVTATIQVAGETGTMWTCTLVHDTDAIMIGYFANRNVAADEPSLRRALNESEILTK